MVMAERARIASNLPVRHCPRHLLRAERCRRRESSTEIHWLVEMLHKVPASPGPGDRSSACFCFWLASWYTTRLPVGWSECVPPRHAMTGELESFYPACLLTAKLNCPDLRLRWRMPVGTLLVATSYFFFFLDWQNPSTVEAVESPCPSLSACR